MVLFLTAVDKEANWREFNCELHSLEACFDLLNIIVFEGSTLVSAYLLDQSSRRMDLPLSAFDGNPVSTAIVALQQEWQLILGQPVVIPLARKEELIRIAQQRMADYQVRIETHQEMIRWVSQWLERTQKTCLSEPSRSYFIDNYERQLEMHQAQLTKSQCCVSSLTVRLNRLEASCVE